MINLAYKQANQYPDDVAQMKRVLNDAGYDATDNDLISLWRDYSLSQSSHSLWLARFSDKAALLGDLLSGFGVCFEQGRQAKRVGQDINQSPWPPESVANMSWIDGWRSLASGDEVQQRQAEMSSAWKNSLVIGMRICRNNDSAQDADKSKRVLS